MPWRRHNTPMPSPAACSFRMPTICSSLNRLLRMPSSFGLFASEDSHYPWTSFRGAPQCAGRSPERCSVEIQFPKDGRKTFNLATVMDGTYFSTIKLPTACEDIYQKVVTCSESNPHFR